MNITVYCYNIHSGKNLFYKSSIHKIIAFFQKNHGDILAFQEVQNNSKYGWQFEMLKEQLGLQGVFGSNIHIADGGYGNAIFSRFPILFSRNFLFPKYKEQRGLLTATIDVQGMQIEIGNTHLGLGKKEKREQISILDHLLQKKQNLSILMGDFNTAKPPQLSGMRDCAQLKGKEAYPTIYPLRRRIDYIFVSETIEVLDYEVIQLPYSDHLPIRVNVRVAGYP